MDPSKAALQLSGFIPMQFITDVDIPKESGAQGQSQVAINDRPFIIHFVKHQIIAELAPFADKDITGWFYQDGLYRLNWSLYEQARYFKGVPPMADLAFGSIRDGNWQRLRAPVSLPGNETLNVTITNEVVRPADFRVQVIWDGIQEGGSQSQVGP